MIYTITLTPFIEKRIRGKAEDKISFSPESTSYNNGGIGLKVSNYLQAYQINNHAFFIGGSNIVPFLKKGLEEKEIPYSYIETGALGKTNYVLLDELEDRKNIVEEPQDVKDIQLSILESMILSKINKNDVLIFEYNGTTLSEKAMKDFYKHLCMQSEVMICDLHPHYYGILKENKANVLLLDEKQLLEYKKIETKLPLSKVMDIIKEDIASLAKIVVYVIHHNDFLIFVEDEIYRITCSIKNESHNIYKEAIISGIVKCYVEDGDLSKLSEECLTMSVGSNISEGLFIPNKKTIMKLKDKITMYRL